MELHLIPNYRKINVSYIRPTNSRGARIKISEPKRYISDKTKTIYLPYDYEVNGIHQQAFNHLLKIGFNVVARCSDTNEVTFLCDNWADEYIELTK